VDISVIGLGKLGACFAAAAGKKGYKVIGMDVNDHAVELINKGIPHIQEPGYDMELEFARNQGYTATTSMEEAVLGSDITFIVVPTPSDADGAFSLSYLRQALGEIGRAINLKSTYHLVVVVSTVLPGSCRYALIPTLAAECPDKNLGVHYGFCYSPEFVALGTVIRDLVRADMLLIGSYDEKSAGTLLSFYAEFMECIPRIHTMSLENAELVKIAVNSFITAKISFANALSLACSRIPGGNVDIVTNAIGDDSRIGRKFLKGGLGFGGPCLPRDNKALAFLFDELGVPGDIATATDAVNMNIPEEVLRIAQKRIPIIEETLVALVCGISYKPGTTVCEESQGVEIANRFSKAGVQVSILDIDADALQMNELDSDIGIQVFTGFGLKEYKLVVIATPDEVWKKMKREWFDPDAVIIDCWRILPEEFHDMPGYVALGVSDIPFGDSHLEEVWRNR